MVTRAIESKLGSLGIVNLSSEGLGEGMEQGRPNRLLEQASLRELVETSGAREDKRCGFVRARMSRLFADLLARLGLLSDFPSS